MTPATHILVNGLSTGQVSALDRGLTYGDGVFRTVRIHQGQPVWWPDHLAKLQADCQHLNIPAPNPSDWQHDFANLTLPEQGVMRLTVTRGSSERGYALPDKPNVTRVVSIWADMVDVSGLEKKGRQNTGGQSTGGQSTGLQGITARLCQLKLGHQPALAGVKHLNRLENVLARSEWNDPAVREGILLDESGFVISGVMSNLFIWKDQSLQTPMLDQCGVSGVARARLMHLARQAGMRVEERRLTLDDVLAAEELMFTNSLIGIWRVNQLEGRHWPTPVISPDLWTMLHA